MEASPLTRWLEAIDQRDAQAALAQFAPGVSVLTADGQRARDREQATALVTEFVSELRSVTHEVTAQWHVDDVWIAEVQATYELRDYLRTGPLPRVLIARMGAEGIADLRVYGAHERPLTDHPTGEEGMWVGGRWVPPL